jgi:hypothetical protein
VRAHGARVAGKAARRDRAVSVVWRHMWRSGCPLGLLTVRRAAALTSSAASEWAERVTQSQGFLVEPRDLYSYMRSIHEVI